MYNRQTFTCLCANQHGVSLNISLFFCYSLFLAAAIPQTTTGHCERAHLSRAHPSSLYVHKIKAASQLPMHFFFFFTCEILTDRFVALWLWPVCACPIRIPWLFFLIHCCPESSLPLSGKIVTPNGIAPFLVFPFYAHFPATDLPTAHDSSQHADRKGAEGLGHGTKLPPPCCFLTSIPTVNLMQYTILLVPILFLIMEHHKYPALEGTRWAQPPGTTRVYPQLQNREFCLTFAQFRHVCVVFTSHSHPAAPPQGWPCGGSMPAALHPSQRDVPSAAAPLWKSRQNPQIQHQLRERRRL